MLKVEFESIYTETDRYGNSRCWENRFKAMGEGYEVRELISDLLNKSSLPGLTTSYLANSHKNLLT